MSHYSYQDIRAALSKLPVHSGDIVFSHSNLGFFGRPEGVRSREGICELFAAAILERIGPDGALVVPTFTYSFPRNEIFDPDNTPSAMGMFAEWVRTHPDSLRSLDPCYSVTALGGAGKEMTAGAPENSFGPNSFFDRFFKADGKILNLNFDAGSTFVHYVERCLNVPYRFDKSFTGIVRQRGREYKACSIIWVRYLSDDSLTAQFESLDVLAREKGLFRTQHLGRGEVGVISARDTYDLIAQTLPARPWLLTLADQMDIEPCIELES